MDTEKASYVARGVLRDIESAAKDVRRTIENIQADAERALNTLQNGWSLHSNPVNSGRLTEQLATLNTLTRQAQGLVFLEVIT